MNFTCEQKAQNKELVQRFFSAVVIVLLTVASVYIGGVVFRIFVADLFGVIAWEWLQATGAKSPKGIATIGSFILMVTMSGVSHGVLFFWIIVWIAGIYGLLCCARISPNGDAKSKRLPKVGVLYAFISLFALGHAHTVLGKNFVMFMFLCIWLTDTGAFFLGKIIGGPKMVPKISPKKTWAGAIGGTVLATAVGTYLGTKLLEDSTASCALLAGGMSVLAHVGDLLESAAKRYIGVKDMSRIIPGHGGFADRFDSVMFVSLACLPLIMLR
jgi:phosphatidate cytidylyltransferase